MRGKLFGSGTLHASVYRFVRTTDHQSHECEFTQMCIAWSSAVPMSFTRIVGVLNTWFLATHFLHRKVFCYFSISGGPM